MKRAIATFALVAGLVAGAGVLAAPAQAGPSRTITKSEVARHGTATDCWVFVGRNVYDMTSYLPRHPGGAVAKALAATHGGVYGGIRVGEHWTVPRIVAAYYS